MTDQEIADHMERINNMPQLEMARLWRFAPSEHEYFDKTLPFFEVFNKRFKELGGFTPAISKQLEWN